MIRRFSPYRIAAYGLAAIPVDTRRARRALLGMEVLRGSEIPFILRPVVSIKAAMEGPP